MPGNELEFTKIRRDPKASGKAVIRKSGEIATRTCDK